MAIAYVFVVVLPKLASLQAGLVNAQDPGVYGFLEHHVYLLALMGFAFFYGVGRIARFHREKDDPAASPSRTFSLAIVGELLGFAGYCVLIGYLLVDQPQQRMDALALFALAMSLHFIGMDHTLAHFYTSLYDRIFRWVLVGATVLGWSTGMLTQVSPSTMALWFSFLAGGIIINAIREELPDEGGGRISPFLLGAAVFALLVLLIEYVLKF